MNISHNKITDLNFIDPECNLKKLRVSNNGITKIGKRVLCPELEYLGISDNKLNGLNNLNTAFPNIEELHIKNNEPLKHAKYWECRYLQVHWVQTYY